MTGEPKCKTLAEITAQLAQEWREQGKALPVPPDTDTMTPEAESQFWDEVERRHEAQAGKKLDAAKLVAEHRASLDYLKDKLGVTGSSPVSPMTEPAGNGGFCFPLGANSEGAASSKARLDLRRIFVAQRANH
jgi:hypothetical protein